MSAAEVAIVVHYQALPGQGDEVAALLSRHTAATRAEPGCRDFVALRGVEDPDSFVLYERYESRAAFEAHIQPALRGHRRGPDPAAAARQDRRVPSGHRAWVTEVAGVITRALCINPDIIYALADIQEVAG